ncbi:hypothetical protein JRO89_XS03G0086000 [Xanthoceras sorbifolium]|uniref:Amine oxidase domain-containing protein n=1 Tax=Xanthoceras sorbifolium TaxID=99658 RepID=A0ABQ8I964_9ROSI|nr:hypothetical protein JRO89_XS03G0086000 [Xanthoceras sorbifolium]
MLEKMRVAVVGAGMSGLAAAHVLAKAGVEVVVYEKKNSLGGHAKAVTFHGVDLDLGFMFFNTTVTCPSVMEMFESLGVEMEICKMSFSVSLDKGQGCEWGTRNGLSSLFAQKKNLLNPYFWQMLRELIKFKKDVISYLDMLENNPDIDRNETLELFIKSRDYSELFQKVYLIPIFGSIWSCPSEGVMSFSAFSALSFCRNHHLLQLFGHPQLHTLRWSSHDSVNKVKEQLETRGCQIRSGCEVYSVSPTDEGCSVACGDGSQELYNRCIMAVDAPDALKMLGAKQHLMKPEYLVLSSMSTAWSACNYIGSKDNKVCLTYWLNVLQNTGETSLPFLVTINPDYTPQQTLLSGSLAVRSHLWLRQKLYLSLIISGEERNLVLRSLSVLISFYWSYRLTSELYVFAAGLIAAHGLLGKSCDSFEQPKTNGTISDGNRARLFVARFLGNYINTGRLM